MNDLTRKQKIMKAIDAGSDNDQYNCNQAAYAADWIIKLQDALEAVLDGDVRENSFLQDTLWGDPDYGLSDEDGAAL